MKVKNSGSVFTSLVIKDVRYDFPPNAILVFPDKDEDAVDAAIKPYDFLNVILENSTEGADTTAEINADIATHNADPAAHSGAITGAASAAVAAHVAQADPHTQYQKESEKNQANGYAGLDAGGKVDVNALPNSVMEFQDFWDASTNTPNLVNGTGNRGDIYEVSVAGTHDFGAGPITFVVGEWVVYTVGNIWKRANNSTATVPDASPSTRGLVSTTAQVLAGKKTFNDGIDLNGQVGTNFADPVNAQDAATKNFVVSQISAVNPTKGLITSGEWTFVNSGSTGQILADLSNGGNGAVFQPTIARKIILSNPATITDVNLTLRLFGGGGTANVVVVGDLAGNPNIADVKATSANVDLSVIPSTFSQIQFLFTAFNLPAGTYWFYITLPSGIAVQFSGASDAKRSGDGGVTWASDTNVSVNYQLNGTVDTSSLSLSAAAYIEQAGLSNTANQINSFTQVIGDGQVIYTVLNTVNTPSVRSIVVADPASVPVAQTTFIVARRIGSKIYIQDSLLDGDASISARGYVSTVAQSLAGRKTFKDGVTSSEEIIISSTANAYASVRSASVSGNSLPVAFASGNSSAGNSGYAILAAGTATKTVGAAVVFQGLTISSPTTGAGTQDQSFQIIVDNTNITNPAAPVFYSTGSAGQRLVARVNSATTINQLMAVYAVSGITDPVITGSGTSTFTSGQTNLNGGNDQGEVVLSTNWRSRIEGSILILGTDASVNSSFSINTPKAGGSDSSNTIFIITGQVEGGGSSGGISIRSADMLSNAGGSGGTFIRTGSIAGSVASGPTTISTGQTINFASANSGNLSLNTGNINGLSGQSGQVNINSGNVNSGTGATGNVTLKSGQQNSSSGSGNSGTVIIQSGNLNTAVAVGGVSGIVTVTTGNHTQTGSTAATGQLNLNTGSNASNSTGGTGSVVAASGNLTGTGSGNTGNAGSTTGTKAAGSTGATGLAFLSSGAHSGTGASGLILITSGTTANGASGQAFILTGNATGGASGAISLVTGSSSSATSGGIFLTTGAGSTSSGAVSAVSGNATGTANTGFAQLRSGNVTAGTGSSGSASVASGSSISGNTGQLSLNTGNTGGSGNAGNIEFSSGNTVDGNSGYLHAYTGSASGTGNSQGLLFFSGNANTGSTGSTQINTGAVAAGSSNSGGVTLFSGNVSGSGLSGNFSVATGITNTGKSGDVNFSTGQVLAGTSASGDFYFSSGSSFGGNSGQLSLTTGQATSGNSGAITLQSGINNGTGNTGAVNIFSGGKSSGGGATGGISIQSAGHGGTGTSGAVAINSGNNASGNSGDVSLKSGSISSGSGNSGWNVQQTGDSFGGNSGSFYFQTGNITNAGAAGNSGDFYFVTGAVAGSGARGKIRFLNGSQGTAGNVWLSTDTNGGGSWAVNKGGFTPYFPALDGSTTTLTVYQNHIAAGGGTANTTFKLPNTAGGVMQTGFMYKFVNKSSTYNMVVQDFGGGGIVTVNPSQAGILIWTGGNWDYYKQVIIPF